MAEKSTPETEAPKSLAERLNDPTEIFTQAEVFSLFEELSAKYGYYRDKKLPPPEKIKSAIAAMTVDGYEHFGVLLVKPLTQRDQVIGIPSLMDKELAATDNLNPGAASYRGAQVLAYARAAIVSPPDLVDEILDSEDPRDANFFFAFNQQHNAWQLDLTKEAAEKKSGPATKATGSESASSSAIAETSSQPAQTG